MTPKPNDAADNYAARRSPESADRDPNDVQDHVPGRAGEAGFPNGPVVHNDGGDLPVIGSAARSGEVAPRPVPGPPAGSGHSVTMTATFGDIKRTGAWVVPAQTRAVLVFGDMYLDLREAQLNPGENVIDVFTLFGDVRVLVPPGVRVISSGGTLFGDTEANLGNAAPKQNAPVVALKVSGVFGDAKVRVFEEGEKIPKRWRWF